jgi:restriction system protein
MWMVRSPNGQYASDLLAKGIVAIGWAAAGGSAVNARTPEDFYEIIRRTEPGSKPQQIINAGRQLYKFFREMKVGDVVATYDSSARIYHVGKIAGEARIDPQAGIEDLPNIRPVKWDHQVERDKAFASSARLIRLHADDLPSIGSSRERASEQG